MEYGAVKVENKEAKWIESHLRDLAAQADRFCMPVYSDFLDTAGQEILLSMQKQLGVQVALDGGYEGAERRMASFCPPFFYGDEEISYPILCLEICLQEARFLKKKPQHRDYLGAVLGTGLDRRKIGDIVLTEEGAVLFVCEDIAGYLTENLRQIGSADVTLRPYTGDLSQIGGSGKEILISVASLRLDAVLSHGFGVGRTEAADWVRAGRVQINHRPCGKGDAPIEAGMILTVRGKGRLKILEAAGVSKSGRTHLRAERFG